MLKYTLQLKNIVLGLFILLVLSSCCEDNNAKYNNSDTSSIALISDNSKSTTINNKLFGIPSPFLTANIGKKLKAKFHIEFLNPVEKHKTYFTSFKQAINLGIYGADLSYLTIYNYISNVESYIVTMKLLSEELGVGKNVDKKTLELIEANANNRDSLMYLIAKMFRNSDAFLFNNDRKDIGVIILSGGWIESLYLITQTLQYEKNQEIIDFVGEQKQPLNNLIELLNPYYQKVSTEYDKLIEELTELARIFDQVEFEYKYEKSTFDTIKKITIINNVRKCIITEEQLKQITKKIASMRNAYVK